MDEKTAEMLTVQEVANMLHVHPNTIRHWSEQGLMKTYRIGPRGDRRFRREDIEDFVDQWMKQRKQEKAVLVVDDDDEIRNLLYEIVTNKGYTVIAVESAEQALKELKKREFDLIFLDLVLPESSGVEVLRHVKASERETVVTVITGYGDTPIAFEAMSLGPMFFVSKPFEVSEILEILDLAMKIRRE